MPISIYINHSDLHTLKKIGGILNFSHKTQKPTESIACDRCVQENIMGQIESCFFIVASQYYADQHIYIYDSDLHTQKNRGNTQLFS
jgi:hypothetical protein